LEHYPASRYLTGLSDNVHAEDLFARAHRDRSVGLLIAIVSVSSHAFRMLMVIATLVAVGNDAASRAAGVG
jgi:hypothetical protein